MYGKLKTNKVNEHDPEIQQSHIADQPTDP